MSNNKKFPKMLITSLIIALMFIGEIQCIIKAIKSDWDPVGRREIVYTFGVLTGVGSIIGWFNIEDS